MKPNIGLINAMVRMTFGFTILAWVTAKMVKRPWRDSYFWVAMLAGMKIAEGITRFCPLTALFEKYQGNELSSFLNFDGKWNGNSTGNNNASNNNYDNNGDVKNNNRDSNNSMGDADQKMIQELAENLKNS